MDRIGALEVAWRGMRAVDLSPRLERGIPRWPTHPHLVIDPTVVHEHDGYYCQSIAMAEHTGARVDVPAHIHADRMHETIDTIPPDYLIGPAVVYDVAPLDLGPGDLLTVDQIVAYERAREVEAHAGDIVLINFGWVRKYWRTDQGALWYSRNAPGIDEAAVRLLSERRVRAVGTDTVACDTPIVDGRPGLAPGHGTYWLPRGILIMESLANLELLPLRCFFVAVPLKIARGSGSPIRPVAFVSP